MKKIFVALLSAALLLTACSKNQKSGASTPKSIVALSPSAVEILYAVGAGSQISAVTDFADYPEEAKSLPKVGGFDGKTLSMEKILSFKPDLVYLTDGMHNFLIEELEADGIAYYISNATSIEAVKNEILEVGKLTGHEKEAKVVLENMKTKLAKLSDGSVENPKTVYYEVWNAPYMSVGTTSFINDVIATAGARNIFDDLTDGYPVVSEESIITRKPDVILLTASSGVTAASIAERAGWSEIPAVKNNKVFVIDDNLYSRPSPRIADAVNNLESLLK